MVVSWVQNGSEEVGFSHSPLRLWLSVISICFFLFLQEIHVRDFGGKLVITAFVLNALIG